MKKTSRILALVCALMIVLSCASFASAEGNRVVTAMINQSHNSEGFQDMLFKTEEEAGITVELQVVPDEQYQALMQMKFASGEAPDFVDYNIPHIYNIIDPATNLVDLTEESWVADLVTKDIVEWEDGKIYGWAYKSSNGFQGMIYNKELFAANGVEVPTTLEELYAACETFKAAGITPILVPGGSTWVPQIWTTAGFARAMGTSDAAVEMSEAVFTNQAKFNDYPQLAAVINEFVDIQSRGYFNEDLSTLTMDNARVEIADGKAAMLLGSSTLVNRSAVEYPETDLGIFNIPSALDENDVLSATLFSYGFVINNKSENVDTVKELFELWSTPEYLDLVFAKDPGFPAFPGVDSGDIDEDVLNTFNKYSEAGKMVPEMNLQWGKIDTLFSQYLWPYYAQALTKHDINGTQIMDAFQEDVAKFLTENKAEGWN